jgi:hypothetical protein
MQNTRHTHNLAVLCLTVATALPATLTAANPNLVADPSFDDLGPDGRPRGWRAPYYEEAGHNTAIPGVTEGVEGETTHTGASALQFVFPPGTIPNKCTWSFDPATGGIDVEPGDYLATFWIKTVNASEKIHFELWDMNVPVENYATGAQGIGGKLLDVGDLPPGEWTQIEVPFSVSRSGVRLGVSFHLLEANPDCQVYIDDLVIMKE